MTITFGGIREVVESGEDARLDVSVAHARFLKIQDEDGSIHLIPWDHLSDGEKALVLSPQLWEDTNAGLRSYAAGSGVTADWLFADEADDEE